MITCLISDRDSSPMAWSARTSNPSCFCAGSRSSERVSWIRFQVTDCPHTRVRNDARVSSHSERERRVMAALCRIDASDAKRECVVSVSSHCW